MIFCTLPSSRNPIASGCCRWNQFKRRIPCDEQEASAIDSAELLLAFRHGTIVALSVIRNAQSVKKTLWGDALWSPSYFAGSYEGAPLEVIRQYIQQQQTPTWGALPPMNEWVLRRCGFPTHTTNHFHRLL